MSTSITTIHTPLTTQLVRAIASESAGQPHAAKTSSAEGQAALRDAPHLQAAKGQAATPPSRTRLRLTRRGRAVFGALATLLLVGLLAVVAMFSGVQAVATVSGGSADFGYVVVQPGGSLWQLASDLDPGADPRDLVAEIVRLNQLGGSAVQAGEPIAVPLRYANDPGVVAGSELGRI